MRPSITNNVVSSPINSSNANYYERLRADEEYRSLVTQYGTEDINEIAEKWLQEHDAEYYRAERVPKHKLLEYPYLTQRQLRTIADRELPLTYMSPQTLGKFGMEG